MVVHHLSPPTFRRPRPGETDPDEERHWLLIPRRRGDARRSLGAGGVRVGLWPQDYAPVGVVPVCAADAEDPDVAFVATQNVDSSWWLEGRAASIPAPTGWYPEETDVLSHRSTSVGDVVELPDGRLMRCLRDGWEEHKPVRRCPHCGGASASPSSNLCGRALMGGSCL